MNTLKRLRLDRGWSQARLARAVGCTEKSVSRWEAEGIGHARFEHVVRAAEALDVSVEDLARDFYGAGSNERGW